MPTTEDDEIKVLEAFRALPAERREVALRGLTYLGTFTHEMEIDWTEAHLVLVQTVGGEVRR